jgi:hypothetical protein
LTYHAHAGQPDRQRFLSGVAKLVSTYTPQSRFQRLMLPIHETAQRQVDTRLVVTASRIVNLLTKPVQNVIVQPNRDPRLSGRHFQNRTPPSFAEISSRQV